MLINSKEDIMNIKQLFAAAILTTSSWSAMAHEYQLGTLHIDHPYARATVTAQSVGGGYMTIENKGPADRLLAVSTDISSSVGLHSMTMEGDVMHMTPVKAIDIPSGATVVLSPGGLHIMFMGLKAPLKAGDSFPMTLKFEKAGEIKVDVKVEAINADMSSMKH